MPGMVHRHLDYKILGHMSWTPIVLEISQGQLHAGLRQLRGFGQVAIGRIMGAEERREIGIVWVLTLTA